MNSNFFLTTNLIHPNFSSSVGGNMKHEILRTQLCMHFSSLPGMPSLSGSSHACPRPHFPLHEESKNLHIKDGAENSSQYRIPNSEARRQSRHPTPGHVSRQNPNWKRCTHLVSTAALSQFMSNLNVFDRQVDKENVAQICNGILLCHKKG